MPVTNTPKQANSRSLNAAQKNTVRVALATGATVATLFGAQALTFMDRPLEVEASQNTANTAQTDSANSQLQVAVNSTGIPSGIENVSMVVQPTDTSTATSTSTSTATATLTATLTSTTGAKAKATGLMTTSTPTPTATSTATLTPTATSTTKPTATATATKVTVKATAAPVQPQPVTRSSRK